MNSCNPVSGTVTLSPAGGGGGGGGGGGVGVDSISDKSRVQTGLIVLSGMRSRTPSMKASELMVGSSKRTFSERSLDMKSAQSWTYQSTETRLSTWEIV